MRSGLTVATLVAVIVAVSGLVAAGGGSASSGAQAKAGGGATLRSGKVEIAGFKFKPANFTVKAGTKVTFTNRDSAAHTATSKKGGVFDTGKLAKGQSETVTLSKPGDFKYYCQFHAYMTGDVKVVK